MRILLCNEPSHQLDANRNLAIVHSDRSHYASITALPKTSQLIFASRAPGIRRGRDVRRRWSDHVRMGGVQFPGAFRSRGTPGPYRAVAVESASGPTTLPFARGDEAWSAETTGVKLRGPEGAQLLSAASASTSELGGMSAFRIGNGARTW